MKAEEKQLLLKDLCGRVPYVTFVYIEWHETEELEIEGYEDEDDEPNIHTLISCNYYGECDLDDNLHKTIYDIKPYLRPMSSMTEDEREEYRKLGGVMSYNSEHNTWAMCSFTPELYDWLNKKMFDYRDLIQMGLAIEAPEGMYGKEAEK